MVDGIVLLDKPVGALSARTSRHLGRLLNEKKAGHGGTLDPMASGLLVVLLGQATSYAQYLLLGDKRYLARITFGMTSTTLDAEGEITVSAHSPLSDVGAKLSKVIPDFMGEIYQEAPLSSALKHKGKPLYYYHKKGVDIPSKKRWITISAIDIYAIDGQSVELDITCSHGTYIRSLARDLGNAIGCGAYLSGLRRLESSPFSVDEAVNIDCFESDCDRALSKALLPIERIVTGFPSLVLETSVVQRLGHGMRIQVSEPDGIFRVFTGSDRFAGLVTCQQGMLSPLSFLHWTRQ